MTGTRAFVTGIRTFVTGIRAFVTGVRAFVTGIRIHSYMHKYQGYTQMYTMHIHKQMHTMHIHVRCETHTHVCDTCTSAYDACPVGSQGAEESQYYVRAGTDRCIPCTYAL